MYKKVLKLYDNMKFHKSKKEEMRINQKTISKLKF